MKINFLQSKLRKQLELLNDLNDTYQVYIKEAAEFINNIEKGNFNLDISERLMESELGNALASMKVHLLEIANEEQKRSWSNTGLAKFSDILRNKQSLTLENLADDILLNLVKYVGANQGALFILEGEGTEQEHLKMIACYAYNRKKFLQKEILPGEGLVGQCLLEKQFIFMKEIPANYVNITSGLGEATPRSVLISPLMINEKVFGIAELASLKEFQPHQIDFINKLAENIGATIKNVKESERTIALLNDSQQQAEELRTQEEEMRQHMEEMQATQEEMKRQSEDLNRATAEMKGILDGINATMATIEFMPDGTIVTANENFLKTMKCSPEQIRNNHHRMFVPDEVLQSDEYKTFWKRLAAGESITGTFKRKTLQGGTVWLNAIYNPIRNAYGKVEKVVKFATDITAEQERLAENRGILNGIDATMATIEFRPDGTIINANNNFLKTVEYSLADIRGKHHRMFVPQDIQETPDYKSFWLRLAAGESITGTFKRISSTGKTIWLNAIYNPILNANGDVAKVIKFATDITAEQEMLAEGEGLLKGIDYSMTTIEFKPNGTIIKANANFLKAMNYSLTEIQGKHHKIFVPDTIKKSKEYEDFWSRLSKGEPMTGVFERVTADGKPVLLNAIYNPIVNTNNEVTKIVKFATIVNS
ncbi:MAG: PAS domain-containing protein [Cyclobacteriaceae bacterium]|nr:PAS domain-containing protein [Cyclobacteriaceae bacterium]